MVKLNRKVLVLYNLFERAHVYCRDRGRNRRRRVARLQMSISSFQLRLSFPRAQRQTPASQRVPQPD
jgi:hypothetical protein